MRTIFFIAAVFVGLVLMVIALASELRKSSKQEAETIARQDEAMTDARDDLNDPARWVP